MARRLLAWRTAALAGAVLVVTGIALGHGAGNTLAVVGVLVFVISCMWPGLSIIDDPSSRVDDPSDTPA